MKPLGARMMLIPLSLLVGALAAPGAAQAVLACYRLSASQPPTFTEALKLSIKLHGALTTKAERDAGHPNQAAYSVHGSHVGGCGANTMAATTGTVIVATGVGAHMGLSTKFVRTPDTTEVCFPIWFECESSEASPTPSSWNCQLRNEILGHLGLFTLTKVNPLVDSLCSVFEDGMSIVPGSASSK